MAKESMKAREVKRAKMAAKYANKRAALKDIDLHTCHRFKVITTINIRI